jgi:preprotein translocase subunit SecY
MKKFLANLKSFFKNKDLLISIAITLAILILYRIGSLITIPNVGKVDTATGQSSFSEIVNLLGGGGLRRFSIFALGISPYITAQIIIQLLSSDLIPPLSRMAKSGEKGRKKIDMISRLVTLPFAILQVFAIIQVSDQTGIIQTSNWTAATWAYSISVLIAGTYFAIFLGDIITKKGIGNGISLIIAAGIIANLPYDFTNVYRSISGNSKETSTFTHVIYFMIYILFCLVLIALVAFISSSTRKIPIQKTNQGVIADQELPYLPIKLNNSGVIPVIFATSLISIPLTIAQILKEDYPKWDINNYLNLNTPVGMTVYFVLVLLFSFLYSYIQTNPDELADNLKNSNSFIPGINPGRDTSVYISKVMYRINWIGGPYIAIIATLPYLIDFIWKIPSTSALGGTGLIISISVCIETYKTIKSSLTKKGYDSLKKVIQVTNTSNENVSNKNDGGSLW